MNQGSHLELTGWTDTHAHLADPDLVSKLPSILIHSTTHRVHRILCVAVDADSLEAIDTIKHENAISMESYPRIWSSAGIHPNYAQNEKAGDWSKIVKQTSDLSVCAVGETGLDRYWDDCPWDLQLANFRRHWTLSRDTGLPVIIHSRECDQEMMEFLRSERQHGLLNGVMHSFCSTYDIAMECIDLGLHISFSGMLTYKKNDALRQVASRLPLDRLLVETDAPYLSPEPKRGQRPNEPANVAYTGKMLAELHGKTDSQLASQTTSNALKLFTRMT